MMKFFLALSLIYYSVFVNLAGSRNLTIWDDFKMKFNKSYATPEEENMRKEIFFENLKFISDHNAKANSSFKCGINRFSATTIEEYRIENSIPDDFEPEISDLTLPDIEYYEDDDEKDDELLPKSLDWREYGIVSNVKNQGDCGSCYAVVTLDMLGLHLMKITGEYVQFSVQEIIDCGMSHGTNGCNGGIALGVFSYIENKEGLSLEKDYPYIGKKGECNENVKRMNVSIKSWNYEVDTTDDALLKQLVNNGPLYVIIDSIHESLLRYSSGIYDDPTVTCKNSSHAVLLIGYGTEDNTDYWILKNSYGESWGENGYFRVAKNFKCGIRNFVLYPIIE